MNSNVNINIKFKRITGTPTRRMSSGEPKRLSRIAQLHLLWNRPAIKGPENTTLNEGCRTAERDPTP